MLDDHAKDKDGADPVSSPCPASDLQTGAAQAMSNSLAAPVPSPERLPASREEEKYTLENLDPQRRAAILADLEERTAGVLEISKKHGVSMHTVTALRRQHEDQHPTLNLSRWKRHTAATLAHFVTRGSDRLVREVDQIPLANLPVAVAIAVDKIAALHDQPQTVVEHRLRVTPEQLNAQILDAQVIDDDTTGGGDDPQ